MNEDREIVRQKALINLESFIKENEYGTETTKDVYNALLKDRRDPER